MLNIYYGRASVDKERFIYETVSGRGFSAASPVVVLVPDQYTLEAERQVFRVTGKEALIGLDVCSISRLEHNVIADTGQGDVSFIDKYGRQMLLTEVLAGLRDELQVYSGNVRKPSFIEMLNDYISQLKQYDITSGMFRETAEALPDGALSLKMRDISRIYSAYDEKIKGKYTDSEDYVELFLEKADESDVLVRSVVWVYGFDSFAPKSLKVLGKLMKLCPEVNVVLTYDEGAADEDLFSLTGKVKDNLIAAARESGAETGAVRSIAGMYPDGRYDVEKASSEIEHLEHELYSVMPVPLAAGGAVERAGGNCDAGDFDRDGRSAAGGITVIESANYYNEAESAAAYILHLVRDKGYRFRDIAVILNDSEKRGAAVGHAFDEYGIPAFIDKKRSISGSGIAVYLSAMISACLRNMRTQDIFRALKTGLGILDQDELERLENYAVCYRIDRYLWKREFTHGKDRYGEDGLRDLERSRKLVCGLFGKLGSILRKKQTYSGFLEDLYRFLTEDAGLIGKLDALAEAQEASGLRDLAEETVQIWQQIVNILDQIGAILGDEEFDAEDFLDIFTVGLKQSEIGIMPTSPDDLVIGTMQRTRVGRIKALVVIGANDGVIPQGGSPAGLFAEQEEERLAEIGFEAGKSDKVRREEERLAIYRNLSLPDSELWISYSAADEEGAPLRPSELIEDILRLFPGKKPGRDILNTGRAEDLIGGRTSTLRHLADAEVKAGEGVRPDPVWDGVLAWYREHEPETAGSMIRSLSASGAPAPVGEALSDIMFSGYSSDGVSASRLENYAGCPFRYFVEYGLMPEERRIFETGLREIGDVYHDSLMKITSELSEKGIWDTVSSEDLMQMIIRTVREEGTDYGDGVFRYSESDRYRAERVEKTLKESVDILVRHARAGKIQSSRYEQVFGRGSDIPPVEVDAGGKKVYIEGKIDRLDLLQNGRVKIIDYKSGGQSMTEQTIRAGCSLQLMLYMKAAQQGGREPAGVFYFYLGTNDVDTDALSGTVITGAQDEDAILAKRKPSMQGMIVNDPETISEILGSDTTGRIASIKPDKSGAYKGTNGNMVLAEGDFSELQRAVDEKVRELTRDIKEGKIDIRPMRSGGRRIACERCQFQAVCRFDTGFRGLRYNDIN